MRPVPSSFLSVLLAALCALCAVQWWRESSLRREALALRAEVGRMAADRGELESRIKAADAEILRLAGSLAELRENSVARRELEEAAKAGEQLRANLRKQDELIREQNAALAKQNEAAQQANEAIRKLAAERDDLARRLNEVTRLYNGLVKEKK